ATCNKDICVAAWAVMHVGPYASLPLVFFSGYQIHCHAVLINLDMRFCLHLLYQRRGNGATGGIGHVKNASMAMATLLCEVIRQYVTFLKTGELNTLLHQPVNSSRPFLNGFFNRLRATQSSPCYMRVFNMGV